MSYKHGTPKIYVNGRFLTQRMTGVERYAWNMCKAMAALGQDFTIVCPRAEILDCYDVSQMHVVKFGFGNSHFWEQCVFPFFFITKRHYVAVSFTGLGSILLHNKVMTIHDLSFLYCPKWFSKSYYRWYKLMTPLAVRTSRLVITVSEFSKSEILRYYPFLSEEKIKVVYSAVDEDQFHAIPDPGEAPERFALAVSSLDPRKNFARLIEAYKGIEGCTLYIVGNANRVFNTGEGMQTIPGNVRLLGRVSDEQLLRLYHQAAFFIFPSLYEGFGLPPIEAMQCGCPVLASDIEVIREVCGDDAAEYFDPYDIEFIHEVIEDYLLHIDEKKKRLREAGIKNASRFSWQSSARRLIQILTNIKR